MVEEENGQRGPQCLHDQSDPDKSLWIKPPASERIHSPAQKRAYCKICGRIKYSGSANVKKIGFYVNFLKELQNKVAVMNRRKITDTRLTNVQVRLIIRDLETDEDFLDGFSNNHYNQWSHFKKAVKRRTGIEDEILENVYRDFKG